MKQGVVKRSWANYCVWARECDTSNPRYWWDAARYLTYLKFKKNIQRCLNKLRKQRLSEMHPHVITWTLEIHTAGNERSEDTLQGIEFGNAHWGSLTLGYTFLGAIPGNADCRSCTEGMNILRLSTC